MKRFLPAFILLLTLAATASAQRFRVGVRVGVNAMDFSLPKIDFADHSVVGGNTKIGFETALIARLNITRHLHLQAEFEYGRTGYQIRYEGSTLDRNVKIHANRIEVPLMLGVTAGPVRLFGGAFLRIAHNERSEAPAFVEIGFNDSDVGIMGGLGVNIRKFFVEARISGYPKSSVKTTVESQGARQTVRVGRNIRYSLSTGFFF